VASDTADDVALQRAAIPKAPISDGDALHPNPAPSAARAHPTLPCTREIKESQTGGIEAGVAAAGITTAGGVPARRMRRRKGRRVSLGRGRAPRRAKAAVAARDRSVAAMGGRVLEGSGGSGVAWWWVGRRLERGRGGEEGTTMMGLLLLEWSLRCKTVVNPAAKPNATVDCGFPPFPVVFHPSFYGLQLFLALCNKL
jgi:hypothetical protein